MAGGVPPACVVPRSNIAGIYSYFAIAVDDGAITERVAEDEVGQLT
jgi:hypothetical protein